MPRIILHLDLDAFFCAVEELHNSSLRGKAFAVGGKPDERGVVSSCSYAARKFGVRSAMPMSRAVSICPGLMIVSSHHADYGEMSRKVMERLHALSPLVEQISIDEAFVDISDLRMPAEAIARQLQARIKDELGLPSSVGVASNKLVAKIATEVGKHNSKGDGPPFAVTLVPAGNEAGFIAPLPVRMLWGVGPKTESQLSGLGIHTIGDLAAWDALDLAARFGEHGRDLARRARGEDDSPIQTEHETKSISQETTFVKDVHDETVLRETLSELAGQVAKRLRKAGLAGSTIKIKLRWSDFTTLTRQITLPLPTDLETEITRVALDLLSHARPPGKAVRLIGIGISGLGSPARQLELWDKNTQKARKLQQALDKLEEKYGEDVIKRGKVYKQAKEK